MDRVTVEIKTSGGHKVVMKEYLTGREFRAIEEAALSEVEFDSDGKTTQKISATIKNKIENAQINGIVVSVDGIDEDVLEKILDMRANDFIEVRDKAAEIANQAAPKGHDLGKSNTSGTTSSEDKK